MPHSRFVAALVVASTVISGAAAAQGLQRAEIESAIAAGIAGKRLNSTCVATSGFLDLGPENGGFAVIVEGPVGRIMRLAAEAKKKYQPFTIDNVDDEVLAANLFVVASPNGPSFTGGSWHRTAPADHLVLKRKGAKGDDPADVLQPANLETFPESWTNAMGGKWDGQGVTATFDLAAFKAMPGDEIDIVVITSAGERRCKIGKKDRAALR
jgi:hypothetical protein